jgi:hypothetical protein
VAIGCGTEQVMAAPRDTDAEAMSTTDALEEARDPTHDESSSGDAGPLRESWDWPVAICGDGIVEGDEECDNGSDNGTGRLCLPTCHFNVCGDGDDGPGEACDDGLANAASVGRCAPDCSRRVAKKQIRRSAAVTSGDLGPDPIAYLDGHCPAGYAALFADGFRRQATRDPLEGDDAIDWVLQPYTAYVTRDGELVWITDETPLLGVRDGEAQAVLAPPTASCEGPECRAARALTGMGPDWRALSTDNCDRWRSAAAATVLGDPNDRAAYLRGPPRTMCTFTDADVFVYCVEQ